MSKQASGPEDPAHRGRAATPAPKPDGNRVRGLRGLLEYRLVISAAVTLAITAVLAIDGSGWHWHLFWRALWHPKFDGGAYQLLLATLATVNSVLLVLWFTAVMTVSSLDNPSDTKATTRAVFKNKWVVCPAALQFYSTALLGSWAWGFPPSRWALWVLWAIGVSALVGYVRLSEVTLEVLGKAREPVEEH